MESLKEYKFTADNFQQEVLNSSQINVDENPGVAQTYDVATIPNLVFFKDGKVVNRVIGVVPDNVLKEKLDALLR